MKNRFTSIYLYFFIADSVFTILRTLFNSFDIQVLEGFPYRQLEMAFHFLILPFAIVQVIIAFSQRLKRSAKIIGLYPLFIILSTLVTGIILFITNSEEIADKNMSRLMQGLTAYLLVVSITQLIAGLWAAKDLAGGHYLTEDIPSMSSKKILVRYSTVLAGTVVIAIIAFMFIVQHTANKIFEVPADLKKYYRSSEFLTKDVFLQDKRLGKVTDIAFGKLDPNPKLNMGVAGTEGALLLNSTLDHKVFIPFSEPSEQVAIVKQKDSCEFLSRRGTLGKRDSSFMDHDGTIIWKYAGQGDSIDDTAVGDLKGDGKLAFVAGFNGGAGIHLLDQAGKKIWEKPDGNVWHVEMVDANDDGALEIVHSNASLQLTVRNSQGDVISRHKPSPYFAHFSLVGWPGRTGKKRILVSEAKSIWLLDFDGKTIAEYDAPHCHNLGNTRGTLVRLTRNESEYFAVIVEYLHWNRSLLFVYNPSKELVYQENIPDTCASIAALPVDNSSTESLLVGCTDVLLKYTVTKIINDRLAL